MTQTLYGAKGGSQTTSDLYTIDPVTGVATSLGPIGFGITGLAFDPTTGILYGVTNKNSAASPKCIITIDLVTGHGTLVGPLGLGVDDSSDICFDSTGQMYGWSTDTTTFLRIDKATGAGTLVGGSEHSGSVSCNSSDVLYKVGFGAGENIDIVDKVTGARTVVSLLGAGPGAGGPSACAFNSTDVLYALWNLHPAVHLVTIDPATGIVADIVATASFMDGLAFSPPPAPPPPPTRRFFRGYPWRFIVTDTSSRTLTFLDRLATNRTVTKAMDQPMDASGNVPSDNPEINILHTDGDPFLNEGNRLIYGFRREGWDGTTPPWVCRFAGPLDHLEDIAGTNSPVTQWTARDPWQYLYRRPLRLEDGSLPGPLGRVFLASDLWTYTEIAYQLLLDTITYDGACHIDAFSGTVAASPVITENVTFQQGLSIGAAWDQICATNKAHIVLDPVYDPVGKPGMCVVFNCYPAIGTVQNAAVFAWDLPSRSLVGINRQVDGSKRANRIQFYFGQGGPPVLLASDAASIAKYGEYWEQQFWPGFKQAGPVQAMAAQQLRLLRDGLISYSFQPAPERSPIPFDDYTVGDWAPFYASKKLRAALQPSLASGQWVDIPRIRAFTLQIADNQTEAVSELLTAKEPLNA